MRKWVWLARLLSGYIYCTMAAVDIVPRGCSVKDIIRWKTTSEDREDYEDPFFVIDLGQLLNLYSMWKTNLPSVTPFYAVKANNDPVLVKALVKLGCGFDCASKREMKMVIEAGADPKKIIFAQTCKHIAHIKYAAQNGVSLMTFDNKQELIKVKAHFPSARLVVRIFSENKAALWVFRDKYGCSVEHACKLLDFAKELGLDVVGVSFHVGSLGTRRDVHTHTLHEAMKVVEYAGKIGYEFSILDIGGGFPGLKKDFELFKQMSADIEETLKKLTAGYPALKVIAEPGRYFCSCTHTLALAITSKRSSEERFHKSEEKCFDYYVTDGYWGTLHWPRFEKALGPLQLLEQKPAGAPQYASVFYGPTSDTTDFIDETPLPELDVGDWIYFEEVGGYSNDFPDFCGYVRPRHYFYVHEDLKEEFSKKCWKIYM